MSTSIKDNFNFIKHSDYDISSIKNIALWFTEEWRIDESRQMMFKTHEHTQSYFLYQTDLDWTPDKPYVVHKRSDLESLLELVEPIIQELEKIHDGTRGQVLLIRLMSDTNIPEHIDSGHYLTKVRRHHIPIITSDSTVFGVGDESINMAEGECWEINNSRTHYVINNSPISRIHLLIDIMPNSEIPPS